MENEGQSCCHSEERQSPSKNCFTIIWEIENSRYFFQAGDKLQSPVVYIDVMERTSWRLELHRLLPEKWIYATVKREAEDHGSEIFELCYDINLTKERELEKKPHSRAFRRGESGTLILLSKGKLGINPDRPHNTTIKCNMKTKCGSISKSGQIVARTQMGGEYFEFFGKRENFCNMYGGTIGTPKVLSSTTEEILMTVDLRWTCTGFLEIVIIPMVAKSEYRYNLSCTILDYSGRRTSIKRNCQYTLEKEERLHLGITYSYVWDYQRQFLQNGHLNFLCEIAILTGIKSEEIGKVGYETVSVTDGDHKVCSFLDLETSVPAGTSTFSFHDEPKFPDASENSSCAVSERSNNLSSPFPNVLDDLKTFYKKGILCDAKLQTATETFPAHQAILSARSPVFEAMFTSNMKEKIEECVHIEDVDAETMKRMLLFLYSDFLEELEWVDAKKLYFASDKYQVLSLKYNCSVILKKSIDLFNCCELLLLADIHRDEDLKSVVKNYIGKHDKEVFMCDKWRDIEKSHPHLAIEVFRAVHLKIS